MTTSTAKRLGPQKNRNSPVQQQSVPSHSKAMHSDWILCLQQEPRRHNSLAFQSSTAVLQPVCWALGPGLNQLGLREQRNFHLRYLTDQRGLS